MCLCEAVPIYMGRMELGLSAASTLHTGLYQKLFVFTIKHLRVGSGRKQSPWEGLDDSQGLCPNPRLLFYPGSEPPVSQLVSDSDSELDSTERLALGSTDTLSNGQKADLEAAQRLAKRLYRLDGFRKADVARHLGKK